MGLLSDAGTLIKKAFSSPAEAASEWYITKVQALARDAGLSGGRAMTDQELAELKSQIERDIKKAAGQNAELAMKQTKEVNREIDKVHQEAVDFERRKSVLPDASQTRRIIQGVIVLAVVAIIIQIVSLFRVR